MKGLKFVFIKVEEVIKLMGCGIEGGNHAEGFVYGSAAELERIARTMAYRIK